MTFLNISIAVQINEVNLDEGSKKAIVSATFEDRSKNVQLPITITFFGKAAEMVGKLQGQLAMVCGDFKYINGVAEIFSTTVCPAAIPGYSFVNTLMRLGKDPEKKETKFDGFANMYGFINHSKKDGDSSALSVSLFGKRSDIAMQYVGKGDLVHFSGVLNVYEGKKGVGLGLKANNLTLMPKSMKGGNGGGQQQQSAPAAAPAAAKGGEWDNICF